VTGSSPSTASPWRPWTTFTGRFVSLDFTWRQAFCHLRHSFLYAAPGHWICIISGYGLDESGNRRSVKAGRRMAFLFVQAHEHRYCGL
jgi:hypothetical protein